jgi:hypothetical protein
MGSQLFPAQFTPRTPLVDPETGQPNQTYGWAFFLALFNRTGGGTGVPLTVGQSLVAGGTPLALTNDFNEVLSGAGGVSLFALKPGQFQVVFNGTGAAINVFPALKGEINALGANAAFSLAAGATQMFWAAEILASGGTLYRTMLPAPVAPGTGAALQVSPANPTGTTSTVGVMMGLGSTCQITPTTTGRISVSFVGAIFNSDQPASGEKLSFRFGTGTAPANGAALTGTQIGQTLPIANPGSGVANAISFDQGGIITGLTLGTPVWLDLALATTNAAGTASIADVSCSALEF